MAYSKNAAVAPALTKVATWYKDPLFAGAVASAAVPFLLEKGWSGAQKLMSSREKARAFKETLSENPHLKDFDSKNTQRYYNTLWRTNPEMARDPIVAGSFIRNQHELSDPTRPHAGVIPGVEQAAKIRESVMKGRPKRPDFTPMARVVHEGIQSEHRARTALMQGIEARARQREEAERQKALPGLRNLAQAEQQAQRDILSAIKPPRTHGPAMTGSYIPTPSQRSPEVKYEHPPRHVQAGGMDKDFSFGVKTQRPMPPVSFRSRFGGAQEDTTKKSSLSLRSVLGL